MKVAPLPYYLPIASDEVDVRPQTLEILQKRECLPYTEEEARVFQVAQKALHMNGVGLGRIGYFSIVAIPITFSLFALKVFDQGPEVTLGMALSTIAISNLFSMYFTGTLPSNASDEANRDQNVLEELQIRFEDLGSYLLLQFKDPEKKNGIVEQAKKIDIDRIKEKLASATTQKEKIKKTLRFFEDVLSYIVSGKTHFNSKLELYLTSLECSSMV